MYGQIRADQAEFLSSGDRILSAAASGAPSAIWEALEHGEKVECLDCIAPVATLLYDANHDDREIAAWWLRRRILGVFGDGEVYQQTVNTLASDPDPVRRSYAANALGEFLVPPGVVACAAAVTGDSDPGVRAAAASALGRLNDDGNGALGASLSDSDSGVKLAALTSAGRINTFSGVAQVAALVGDPDPLVRKRAVEILDSYQASDTVAAVLNLAQHDTDAGVRLASCHALGTFGDSSVQSALLTNLADRPDTLVRDQANIALQRL